MEEKKIESSNNLVKRMLQCKKTIEHLKETKEDELVFKDY